MVSFGADEILQMAEQVERNGAAFYRKAAETADGENRELLLRLAGMEDDHEKTFAAMRDGLTDEERRTFTPDPDDQGVAYLQTMADGKAFVADPEKLELGKATIKDVLKIAISMEKDTVVFYQSMKGVVPKSAGLKRLDAIIQEEIGHIIILTKQLGTVMGLLKK